MKTSFFLLVILLPIWSFSQSKSICIHVKHYTSLNYQTSTLTGYFADHHPILAFGGFSRSLSFVAKKRHFTELEWFKFQWGTPKTGATEENSFFQISFQVEQSYCLTPNSKHKVVPYLGIVFRPYFDYFRVLPAGGVFTGFPSTVVTAGTFGSLSPRIIYHFNERFLLDINLPINLINAYYQTVEAENPILTERQRKNRYFKTEFFQPFFQLRIGFGVKIGCKG